MSNAKNKLTPAGRLLLVERVLVDGWSPAHAAKMSGVSRQTLSKWLRRFRDEGHKGLEPPARHLGGSGPWGAGGDRLLSEGSWRQTRERRHRATLPPVAKGVDGSPHAGERRFPMR